MISTWLPMAVPVLLVLAIGIHEWNQRFSKQARELEALRRFHCHRK